MEKKNVLGVLLLAILVGGCSLLEGPITSSLGYSDPVERPYALEKKTIMADDVNMAYMEAGSGPTVILLHGGVIPMSMLESYWMSPVTDYYYPLVLSVPQSILHSGAVSTADTWNFNIEALAQNYHVVALDLPGFGGSEKPRIKYRIEDFVTYLDAFMEAKGIEKASLVGHGLGGQISIAYALEYPDNVEKLVLVDSFGCYNARTIPSPQNLPRPVMMYWQKEKASRINTIFPLITRLTGKYEKKKKSAYLFVLSHQDANASPNSYYSLILSREGDSGKFLDSVINYKLSYITSEESQKEVHAANLALMDSRRRDFAKKLPDIEVPALIINGFYDPVVLQKEARLMEMLLPRAQLMIYERSGHYPMVEQAEHFNRDVSFFLSSSDLVSK